MRVRPRRQKRVTSRQLVDAVEAMPLEEVLQRLDALKRKLADPMMWGVKLLLYERAVELLREQSVFYDGEGNDRLIPAAVRSFADPTLSAHRRLN